ncbi:hypothetical protein chiPu_0021010 [Chiloscyllium punctatum]|uniref:Uncharacterized protein n=1 Tax=Chiloscyllium punctatum TaxID=137246 RepID=A0A401RMA6_CHIPU|nr:hypothetical protein [Chiloscyllium punctatum]
MSIISGVVSIRCAGAPTEEFVSIDGVFICLAVSLDMIVQAQALYSRRREDEVGGLMQVFEDNEGFWTGSTLKQWRLLAEGQWPQD